MNFYSPPLHEMLFAMREHDGEALVMTTSSAKRPASIAAVQPQQTPALSLV